MITRGKEVRWQEGEVFTDTSQEERGEMEERLCHTRVGTGTHTYVF